MPPTTTASPGGQPGDVAPAPLPPTVTKETSTPDAGAERSASGDAEAENVIIRYEIYQDERQLVSITKLIDEDLSEPYSVYTYRYFINKWPDLCWMAVHGDQVIGVIVCKLDEHVSRNAPREETMRGYIAMLVVKKEYRGYGIGSTLVKNAIGRMRDNGCEIVVLETEVTNEGALALYAALGFLKDKRLLRYYLNGVDAFRLKVWL
eukprot:TRINITY_DN11832_c0_g1_i1.p1 TRINITY_DN11832_c0_g1~~TRINITY_DN11832_c0_g1_i1.p1  ORF type:complete len:206 (+),score=49.66 TRINITY_DN11832_c0_g1_i1:230-847(+)